MSTRTESRHSQRGDGAAALLLALLLLLAFATAPVARSQEAPAQEAPAAGRAPAAEPADEADEADGSTAQADLRASLEERYRAFPARDGVLLVPREEMPGIRSVQVTEGEVAVNGEVVSPTILRSWLGAEAEPLLSLAALDGEAIRTLLPLEEAEEAEETEEGGQPIDGEAEEAFEGDEPGLPPAPPTPPAAPEDLDAPRIQLGQQFKLGSDVFIDDDEVATEAVAIGGSVRVDGQVRRDVVAVGGSVEVEGVVGGEIVAVLGSVILGPDAEVRGNVMAVGGEVRRAPGARIGGDVSEITAPFVGGGDFDWEDWADRQDRDFVRGWRVQDAYWNLVGAVLLGLLACLALLVGRGVVERVESRLRNSTDFLVAGLVGLAVFLLLFPVLGIVAVLLIITIVGCLALPLLPFALLALAIAALFGYAGLALRVGRWCQERFGWSIGSPYLAVLLGVALIQVWRLVAEGLEIFGGPVWFFAVMFLVLGVLIEFAALAVAVGAILMNMVDQNPPGGSRAALQAPAGPPAGPPGVPPATLPGGTLPPAGPPGVAPAPGAPPAGSGAPAPPPVPPPETAPPPEASSSEAPAAGTGDGEGPERGSQ